MSWVAQLSTLFPTAVVETSSPEGAVTIRDGQGGRTLSIAARSIRVSNQRVTPALSTLWSVVVQRSGTCAYRTDGSSLELTAGEALVHDTHRPVSLELPGSHAQQLLLVPRGWTMKPVPARVFAGAGVQVLSLEAEQPGPLVPIVSVCVSPHVRVRRALETMWAAADDASFGARDIASAQNVSRRTLDALFAECGATVDGVLWEVRLLRARERVKQRSDRLVSVALESGFKTEAHFSRRYRQRFGLSPSQDRRAVSLCAVGAG
jgi:AraC-like DNA-binding protein